MLENTEGVIKKDNPEKLATQDEERKSQENTCVGHHYTQTNTNNANIFIVYMLQETI
jgi:hypothetical protein